MTDEDRRARAALAEAGYMPVRDYVEESRSASPPARRRVPFFVGGMVAGIVLAPVLWLVAVIFGP